MKIGLLAYHSAINFGATLQLFSTYCFLKEKGHYPIIINWTAKDLALYYEENASEQQRKMQLKIRKQLWKKPQYATLRKKLPILSKQKILKLSLLEVMRWLSTTPSLKELYSLAIPSLA